MPSRRRPVHDPVRSSDPFAGVERVFIDGSNLLHSLARARSSSEHAPAGAIVGRLRASFPPSVIVDLILDGPPSGGLRGRLATGLRVSYSGRATADRVIVDGVAAQLDADGPAGTWGILVVTDDRGLQDAVRAQGARTVGTSWLAGRLGRSVVEEPTPAGRPIGRSGGGPRGSPPALPLPKAGTTIGHRRPPRRIPPDDR